jgi:hypothetical protein
MPQEIIVIDSSSDDGARSDDSVILTGAPSTSLALHSPKLKIVHGSAVEPDFIPPPPSVALRKDFIWAAVSKCQPSLAFISCLP